MYGLLGASYLRETSSVRGFPVIVFDGNCPLGFISVAACCCHSRGWMTFGWCLFPVAQFLSVWAQVETLSDWVKCCYLSVSRQPVALYGDLSVLQFQILCSAL